MNPRTLRALLPVLKEARDAGVLELEAGEGKSRIRLRLAEPSPASGTAIEPGTDIRAPDGDDHLNPNKILAEHYRLHGARANETEAKGS